MLMLRLQKKEVSPETQIAIKQISRFIALLAHNFRLDEEDKLFANEDSLTD